MSPPIRDGSGNSIGSIRLGDGSEISEVRTGAGDVLFSGSAIPDSVIDDFEEYLYESQANTLSDIYGGELSLYSRQTSTVTQGTYALEANTSGSSLISSTSGLERYPSQGDTFRANVYSEGGDCIIGFFGQNENGIAGWSGYVAQATHAENGLRIARIDNGAYTTLSNIYKTPPLNEWLEVEVQTATDNTITMTWYYSSGSEIGSTSVTDATYTSGGIAWWSVDRSTNTPTYFDNFRLI